MLSSLEKEGSPGPRVAVVSDVDETEGVVPSETSQVQKDQHGRRALRWGIARGRIHRNQAGRQLRAAGGGGELTRGWRVSGLQDDKFGRSVS